MIPGGIFVLLFALAYMRFLAHLPGRFRRLVGLAGTVYVSGALGLELAESYLAYAQMAPDLNSALVVVEECLEMAGVTLFAFALLSYMAVNGIGVAVGVVSERSDGTKA